MLILEHLTILFRLFFQIGKYIYIDAKDWLVYIGHSNYDIRLT